MLKICVLTLPSAFYLNVWLDYVGRQWKGNYRILAFDRDSFLHPPTVHPLQSLLFQFINLLFLSLFFLSTHQIFSFSAKFAACFLFLFYFSPSQTMYCFSKHSFISLFSILYFKPSDFPLFLLLLIPSTPTSFFHFFLCLLFHNAQCVLCKVYFSAQPNKLRPILKFKKYYPIEQ